MFKSSSATPRENHLPTIIRLRQFSTDWRGTMILSPCPTLSYLAHDDMGIFDRWSNAHVCMVVTLLEKVEINALGFDSLAAHLSQTDILWHHFPIRNMDAPANSSELRLQEIIIHMTQCFNTGKAVFIHCHAGLGRTGLVAATVLKSFGMTTNAAMSAIRKKRPGSIESHIQEIFVENWNFKLPDFPPRL